MGSGKMVGSWSVGLPSISGRSTREKRIHCRETRTTYDKGRREETKSVNKKKKKKKKKGKERKGDP